MEAQAPALGHTLNPPSDLNAGKLNEMVSSLASLVLFLLHFRLRLAILCLPFKVTFGVVLCLPGGLFGPLNLNTTAWTDGCWVVEPAEVLVPAVGTGKVP